MHRAVGAGTRSEDRAEGGEHIAGSVTRNLTFVAVRRPEFDCGERVLSLSSKTEAEEVESGTEESGVGSGH